MSISSNDYHIKQGLLIKSEDEPSFAAPKRRYYKIVAVDPLTHVPYFDAFNGEMFLQPESALIGKLESQQDSTKIYDISVHSDMLRVRSRGLIGGLARTHGRDLSVRGKVRGFSRKSRKRMIEMMAAQRHGTPQSFLTLTYPDEIFPFGRPGLWKRNLEAFRRRFEREYPEKRAIWRLETEKRKSGRFLGAVAPHFHMLVWDVDSDELATWARQAWWEIVGSQLNKHKEHGTHCAPIRSRKHAYWYVSKYVAKVESTDDDILNSEVGRRWGRIGQFDVSESFTATMTRSEYVQFRRLIAGWMKAKRRDYAKRFKKASARLGCTVFGMGDSDHKAGPSLLDGAWWDFVFHAMDLAKQKSASGSDTEWPAWARLRMNQGQ